MAKKTSNGANLGFEKKLWSAACKLRGNMDAAEYKHVVLGLIFLKYISDAFLELYNELKNSDLADPEDPDEYKAKNVFWVPKGDRWNYLQDNAKKPEIGKLMDDAVYAIEKSLCSGKDYKTPSRNKTLERMKKAGLPTRI